MRQAKSGKFVYNKKEQKIFSKDIEKYEQEHILNESEEFLKGELIFRNHLDEYDLNMLKTIQEINKFV